MLELGFKCLKMKNCSVFFLLQNFQKTVAALEDENLEERRQLDDVHTQRVQAVLNERKRETVKAYRDAMALSMDSIQPHKVLKTLQVF